MGGDEKKGGGGMKFLPYPPSSPSFSPPAYTSLFCTLDFDMDNVSLSGKGRK